VQTLSQISFAFVYFSRKNQPTTSQQLYVLVLETRQEIYHKFFDVTSLTFYENEKKLWLNGYSLTSMRH